MLRGSALSASAGKRALDAGRWGARWRSRSAGCVRGCSIFPPADSKRRGKKMQQPGGRTFAPALSSARNGPDWMNRRQTKVSPGPRKEASPGVGGMFHVARGHSPQENRLNIRRMEGLTRSAGAPATISRQTCGPRSRSSGTELSGPRASTACRPRQWADDAPGGSTLLQPL